jgi:hypothetical protein
MNAILYKLLRNAALVRLAKGALAVAVSAACAYLVTALADMGAEVPPIIIAIGTPLLLALDKFMQAWGKA